MKNNTVVLYMPEKFRIEDSEIDSKGIIVKPTYLSVCNADKRYYFGDRPIDVLKKKLPLVLIHEAAGEVVSSDNKDFKEGDDVLVVPISRDISPLEHDYNYDYPGSKFMSSSVDGCMKTLLQLSPQNLVKFSNIKSEYASTVEVASIAYQALTRLKKYYNINVEKVAIWGTGAVAFWMALLMKTVIPNANITILGRSPKKLESFTFVDNTILAENLELKEEYDLVIEAVGGHGTEEVLQKSIKIVKPVGCILMLGVSENTININTREWMEKGIIILTSHRSTYKDFAEVTKLIEESPIVQQNIHTVVSQIIDVRNLDDIHQAMSTSNLFQFKTVMKWNLGE